MKMGVVIGMIKSSRFIGGSTIGDTSLSLHSILHCAFALLVELKANARRPFVLILGDSLLQNGLPLTEDVSLAPLLQSLGSCV
jgi:hypothetical protein